AGDATVETREDDRRVVLTSCTSCRYVPRTCTASDLPRCTHASRRWPSGLGDHLAAVVRTALGAHHVGRFHRLALRARHQGGLAQGVMAAARVAAGAGRALLGNGMLRHVVKLLRASRWLTRAVLRGEVDVLQGVEGRPIALGLAR